MIVRLLGGSWHSKKIVAVDNVNTVYLDKCIKKRRRGQKFLSLSIDDVFVHQREVYERQVIRKVEPIVGTTNYLVEIRVAFVKKDSKIKQETFWKLGLPLEKYEISDWMVKFAPQDPSYT